MERLRVPCNFALAFLGFCSSTLAARDDVLVIVNDNSVVSPQIGIYYAQQRDINPSNIVHVKVSAGYYTSWDGFRSLRDQIIKHMQAHTLDASAGTPKVCNVTTTGSFADTKYYCDESIGQLAAHTKIKYIVTTKGVPTLIHHVATTSLSDPGGVTSVDNYLRFWLVNYYTQDTSFTSLARAASFGDGRGMRTVIPAQDKELIIGRIDGLTYTAAVALVERAMAAERNGIYGRLFGASHGSDENGNLALNSLGELQWLDFSNSSVPKAIYPLTGPATDAWRYQFGFFGESDPLCADYTSNYLSVSATALGYAGKAPSSCKVVISEMKGNESIPGHPNSRVTWYGSQNKPLAVDGLIYIGNQDGQASGGDDTRFLPDSFDYATNWRKTADTNCNAYCTDDACRNASTDPTKEIDTRCVGVAEGFIGHNLQSYPVAGMYAWPSGWHGPTNGAYTKNLSFPEVRNDSGSDDSTSLWFRDTDQVSNPQCFAGANAEGVTSSCTKNNRQIKVYQTWDTINSPSNGMKYRVSLKAKGEDLNVSTSLIVTIYVATVGHNDWSQHPASQTVTLLALGSGNSTGWLSGSADLILNLPTLPSGQAYNHYLRLEIASSVGPSSAEYQGAIGLDELHIQQIDPSTGDIIADVAQNPTLTGGFRQTSGGDFPSMFLSRMNGAAFWGSVSHHNSGGASFADGIMERLIYWVRGLSLGEAVWFAEGRLRGKDRNNIDTYYGNSGILYGDPLYSPISVYLKNISTNKWNFLPAGGVTLTGSAVNGRDSSLVSTTYAIDYCSGSDFYVCASNQWIDSGLSGAGGQDTMTFGPLNLSQPGQFTLRLAVTSTNTSKGKAQTFYDYYPIVIYTSTSDLDGDGLKDIDELSIYGTDPTKPDTDGDGLSDGAEVNTHDTNPLLSDTDGDGLNDGAEVNTYDTNPLLPDTDGDGYSDKSEVTNWGNPLDANSLPLAFTSPTVLPSAVVGVQYNYQLTSTWPNSTYRLVSINIEGMSIDSSTGLISWSTPPASVVNIRQSVAFSVTAVDGSGIRRMLGKTFSILVTARGDINEDGFVDAADIALAERFALGLSIPTASQLIHADVAPAGSPDGIIDSADVERIRRNALGLEAFY